MKKKKYRRLPPMKESDFGRYMKQHYNLSMELIYKCKNPLIELPRLARLARLHNLNLFPWAKDRPPW